MPRLLPTPSWKGISRVSWNTLSERTWTRKYFRRTLQSSRTFIEKKSQKFESRSFENRSEYRRRCGSRQELETSGQIEMEINGTKLTPESHYRSGSSRSTSIKRAAKKAQTSPDEATEHIGRHLRLKMALVHPNSCECTKSKLDLLGVPPTQTIVEHGYVE